MSKIERPTSAKHEYFAGKNFDDLNTKFKDLNIVKVKKVKQKIIKPIPSTKKMLSVKQSQHQGVIKYKKKTLWSSKHSVNHIKPIKKKKLREDYRSHSPKSNEQNIYLEYNTPSKIKKTRFNETATLSASKMMSQGYSSMSNFSKTLNGEKRAHKEFRIQRSSRSKNNSKTKTRPPLYANTNSFEPFNSADYRTVKQVGISDEANSTMKVLQSKSQYVQNLADKSVAQILSHHQASPGNMYFPNHKASAEDLEQEFTNRLKEDGCEITSRTIKHASKTFEEIISQDIHFGNLLAKIKNAYEAYIKQK